MGKWIITCNPKYYDVVGAFQDFQRINWKQSVNVQVGDIVYIYIGKPYSSIKFETKAIAINLPELKPYDSEYVIDGTNFEEYGRYMELQLLKTFDDNLLPYELLKAEGLKSVQSPSRLTNELEKFILNKTNQLQQVSRRRYFFVFQNKSYNEESKGEYLWSPQHDDNGKKVSHWDQMRDVRKGDLILHSYLKEIVAISVAKSNVYEANRPVELSNEWNNKGWRVDTEYYTIANPIVTSNHMNKLMELQPKTRAPFNIRGRGNTGYLFTANKEMAEYIIGMSASIQKTEAEKKLLLGLLKEKDTQLNEKTEDQKLINDIDKMLIQMPESVFPYSPEPKEKPEAIVSSEAKSYPRNRQVSMNALIRASHNCEIDSKHPSFIRKSTNIKYAEPHHLIPMGYQNQFEHSLDVEANIVSLCSTCHNQIHYGNGADKLIGELYNKRKKELEQAGIAVNLENLLNLYYI
ncbi:HNH endonuclease [Virgibacillus ainsalahensis]